MANISGRGTEDGVLAMFDAERRRQKVKALGLVIQADFYDVAVRRDDLSYVGGMHWFQYTAMPLSKEAGHLALLAKTSFKFDIEAHTDYATRTNWRPNARERTAIDGIVKARDL